RLSSIKKSARDRSERRCPECGRLFIPEYGVKARTYCQPKCGYRAAKRDAKAARKMRQRQYLERAAKVSRYAVQSKGGGRCYICHEMIWSNVDAMHPLAFSIDHIVPLSQGGEHVLDNCLPAHRVCNIMKSDRVLLTESLSQLCYIAVGRAVRGDLE